MADVKVPALLHKMSVSSQKAWYNKHNMALPGHLTGGEGKSAAQAKKDVGEINKAKAKEDRLKVIAAAAKKVAQPSSDRVRAMRQNANQFGGGLGGGLDRNRDIMSYVRSGGYIKAGRLGEKVEQIDEDLGKVINRAVKSVKRVASGWHSGVTPKDVMKTNMSYDAETARKLRSGPDDGKTTPNSPQDFQKRVLDRRLRRLNNKSIFKTSGSVEEETSLDEGHDGFDNYGGGLFVHTNLETGTIKLTHPKHEPLTLRRSKSSEGFKHPDDGRIIPGGITSGLKSIVQKYRKHGRSLGEETSLDEARVDHREFATAGIMHPDMAHSPRMKTGNMTDFYSRKNGDKLHGKILSNDKKTVRIEHEGKVHKFDVRRGLPTSMYKEDKDDREYGYEGDMAMSQLKSIIANSQKMHDMLDPETDLPEWVQSKITLAEDYIVTAANYLQGEMNEESVNEGSEGKTPETETEVNLAKKHGDPKKITYGDVIKARIESAKNKALKKGD
jgi:hypothetical protein